MSGREDEKWMRECFALAKKGAGSVSPNPLVGAIIVLGESVLGKGYHRKFGEAHAEVVAMNNALERHPSIRGATLYVNLEPCVHHGKTPPCVEAIIAQGILKVVAAMKDPNPLVAGKGFAALRKAGVKVVSGMLGNEAERLNEKFIKYITTGIPFVALKVARTSDGFIAKKDGSSKWISTKASRTIAHRLRSEYDAVLVGAGTAMADNPKLTVRNVKGRNPIRVLVDGKLRTPIESTMFNDKYRERTIVLTGRPRPQKVRAFKRRKVQVISMKNMRGVISVRDILTVLAGKGIAALLVEGGQSMYRQFLKAKAADKIYLFTSRKKFGEGISAFDGVDSRFTINHEKVKNIDGDSFIEGKLTYRKGE
ncbi:MAG: bifunctional diaminohydroxyphosphoribosylaminopyrimidine deaminase/5-amino-6-(5-phosphoribosylamino)uracil reductase RibD [Bacteroidota bacterium]